MKLIRAIVRSERESEVLKSLESGGFFGITKAPVLGHGNQQGIQVGEISYDLLSKLMLLVAVPDDQADVVIDLIEEAAFTGHPGDGKIFVQNIVESYTIRIGEKEHETR